jgi:Xaa-Pro dipeptidase
MSQQGIAASLVVDPGDQFYLSGFKAVIYSRPILLLVGEGRTSLVVPGLEEEHAKSEGDADEVLVYYEHPEMADRGTSPLEHLDALLSAYPAGSRVGVEMDSCPVSLVGHVEGRGFGVVDIGRKITEMRYAKDEGEIGMMAEAGRLVNLAVRESLAAVRPGATEMEVDAAGNKALFERVAREHPGATLDSMVMTPSGSKRSIMPHVFSNTRRMEEGDALIHSRQVALNGYRAELERTVVLGEPTPRQAEAFEAAREAQRAAMDFIEPGVTAARVDEVARDVLREAGFGEYAIHRAGHGLGISAHEEPYLRFDNDLVLEEGMVYCVEPGIYVPGLGGFRHSDTVVLTSEGSRPITEYPTDLASLTIG